MKKKFIESSLRLIKNNKSIDELGEKKLRYGLEGFYNVFVKTIVMLILAILLNIVVEYILLILVYSTLRLYGFGIHMKTSTQCWFTTVPIYIGGCFLMKYVTFSSSIALIVWLFGFLSFLLFAPADTPARPLIHPEKRKRAKILSLLILSSYFIFFYCIQSALVKNIILYGVIMESISINPIVYKLFHTPFNNYKSFVKTTV